MATATAIKERSIVMDAREVRGILDGTITQLWRVVKPQPVCFADEARSDNGVWYWWQGGQEIGVLGSCPFGEPGDRLWVREAWRAGKEWNGTAPSQLDPLVCSDIRYEADGITSYGPPEVSVNDGWGKVRQSIHMPRWASRLTLEVTDVRVQRVNEISQRDARAVGIAPVKLEATGEEITSVRFQHLWDSLNAKRGYPFRDGPWVWCVTFKRLNESEAN